VDSISVAKHQSSLANMPLKVYGRRLFVLQAGFWGMLAICLMNLNGVTAMIFNQTRLMSLVLLLFCSMILLDARTKFTNCIGRSCGTFFLFMTVYLTIGLLGNVEVDLFLSHLSSIIIVFASSVAAFVIAEERGGKAVMLPLTFFAIIGAGTVFLTPMLAPYYSNMKNTEGAMNAGRWLGFFANPNETGMASVIALMCYLTTYQLCRRTMVSKSILVAVVLFLSTAAFLTFSRGAILSFFIIAILHLIFKEGGLKDAVASLMFTMIVITLAYGLLSQNFEGVDWTNEQRLRLESMERLIYNDNVNDADFGNRTDGVEGGLRYWAVNPLLGNGLGTMHRMPFEYFGGLGCHNTHLAVLGEVGVVGFLFYLLWLFVYLQESLRVREKVLKDFFILTIVLFGLYGWFSHGVLDSRGPNLLLGVCFGLLQHCRVHSES
jgi:hypothetical protein